MSWSDLFPTGPGTPPGITLRELVLAALAEAVTTRRADAAACTYCELAYAPPCPDHADGLAAAAGYEAAYMRLRGVGSDGAMLELTGGLR